MKLVHLTQSASTLGGGISEAVRALTTALERDGKLLTVVSVRDEGSPLRPWPDGSPMLLDGRRGPGMSIIPGLARTLGGLAPDVIHTHGLWTWFSAVVPGLAAGRSIPYVVSPHGMLDAWALSRSAWKKRLAGLVFERRHLRGAACLHALCESEAASIRGYGLGNPVAVIPNGVDLVPLAGEGSAVRDGKNILLFLGRLHPKKGLVNSLRAWRKVVGHESAHGARDEWVLVIAGWDQGGHEAELKRACDEVELKYADLPADKASDPAVWNAGAEGVSVVFTGPAFGAAKDNLLRRATAFVLPSFSEGLPVAVLEAWSYGLPALLTDHCNLPEGFAAGAARRIGTDVEDIAKGLREFINLPRRELDAMGRAGRALVEARFTWKQVADQMDRMYCWLLGGGATPDFVRVETNTRRAKR